MGELQLVNIEATIVGYLRSLPAITAPVGTRIPNPRPAAFIRVQRVGGEKRNMIQERPVVLIECWGGTEVSAWTLASNAWAALDGREELTYGGAELAERSLSSPVNYPDPSTTSPRYQFNMQTTVNLKGFSP